MAALRETIASLLENAPVSESTLDAILGLVLEAFRSETGTLHLLDARSRVLHLAAHRGLPAAMLDAIRSIPVGKGIAGQTVARGEPVTLCNLQTDSGGVALPGARQSGVGAALCVPLRRGERPVGTLGIGTVRTDPYTPEQTKALQEIGNLLGSHLPAGERHG